MDKETFNLVIEAKICPYCGKKPKLVDSSIVYGKSYGLIYYCKPCDAYVGTHKDTEKPLGRLANKELRYFKKLAHSFFDSIWHQKIMNRHGAYKWLSEIMVLPPEHTHIGMFDVDQCKKVVEESKKILHYEHEKNFKKQPSAADN
jgi:hypothetical protein